MNDEVLVPVKVEKIKQEDDYYQHEGGIDEVE